MKLSLFIHSYVVSIATFKLVEKIGEKIGENMSRANVKKNTDIQVLNDFYQLSQETLMLLLFGFSQHDSAKRNSLCFFPDLSVEERLVF